MYTGLSEFERPLIFEFRCLCVCVSVCLCVRTHKYTTFRGQSLRVRRGFQTTSASQTALNTTQLVVQLPSPVDVCGRSDLRQTVSINALLVRGVLSNNIYFWRSRPPPPKHLRSSPRCTASCTNQPRPQLRYTSMDACAFAAAEARLDPHFSVLTEGWCVLLCAMCLLRSFWVFFDLDLVLATAAQRLPGVYILAARGYTYLHITEGVRVKFLGRESACSRNAVDSSQRVCVSVSARTG